MDIRKWPNTRSWQFTMHPLGADDHGTWLWAPAGTVYARPEGPERVSPTVWVVLVTPDRWWTCLWYDDPDGRELYVDVATPATWVGDRSRVTMIDLDLDVVRDVDGTVELLDEDEFEPHRIEWAYPDHVVAAARTTAAQLVGRVTDRGEPFGSVGLGWLQRACHRAGSA